MVVTELYQKSESFCKDIEPPYKQRVFAYIDGFNLYHGVKSCRDNGLKWLDLRKFIEFILNLQEKNNTYTIEKIKYFTALSYDEKSRKRQQIYLEAIQNLGVEIIYGKFIKKGKGENIRYEEKATDVNIVCNILVDSYEKRYDTALIVSGDGDIAPVLEIIKKAPHYKKVIVSHPPNRRGFYMEKIAHKKFYSTKRHIKKCLFADKIIINGKEIKKPDTWS